ncbi:DNA gyrase inhibitor YacG [Thiorhodovibrio frisius]|uniref:DNA gyrase inhibitor YacG n=1 Tax=Thiorhodovibrio frisius TaxID=631362 RepID=H8YZ43_9GAMM|nr:DNA gyrase inhibitor YacG [Thiorhodovibrio frisius]EIC21970.1 hypothetical protein Thi970DRAFT_02207 [Thiorhodovibrio frisius]WPL24259.1 DNA gyrase inhibitor YacG [Thiorhodovibrio frisius]
MPTSVPCPTCDRAVPWVPESRWRPFCSERCRLIDLGDWLDEAHRIPGDPNFDDSAAAGEDESRLCH